MTSPSVGTIRISCDSSHQIIVSIVCVAQCDKFGGGSNGYSPLTETGFDPGKVYTVFINLFDGKLNQVMLNDERITQTVTVISTTSSKIVCSMQPVMCCYSICGLNCNTKINNQVSYSYITSTSRISLLLHETEGEARGRVLITMISYECL